MKHGIQLLTGLAGAAAIAPACSGPKAQKPNIVIIYTDDMGIGDVSFLNDGWTRTPHIDRLAGEGIVMTQYYSAAPVSSPSRVGITTGMYPLQWGINTFLQGRAGNARAEQLDFLDAAAPSMARFLQEGGYHTAHIGKWHMGGGRDVDDAPAITRYGFDEYLSTWESPDPDPLITGNPGWIWSNEDSVKRWNRTAYFVDKTLDFLARHKGEPCFVNLWPDDVHDPWVQGPEVQDARDTWTTRPNFEQVLAEYDRQIGRFMQGLADLGLDENTIVVFTSDNGPSPSFKQIRTNGRRGVKNSLYEGGINMPFAVRWPAKIKPGQVDTTTVMCAIDLVPTLCAMAGVKLPASYQSSREDMSKALTGKPITRKKDLMWDFGRNAEGFNFPPGPNRSPHLAIRRGNMKLLMNADGTSVELYDLSVDPDETTDIAGDNPQTVSQLSESLLQWWDTRKTRDPR